MIFHPFQRQHLPAPKHHTRSRQKFTTNFWHLWELRSHLMRRALLVPWSQSWNMMRWSRSNRGNWLAGGGWTWKKEGREVQQRNQKKGVLSNLYIHTRHTKHKWFTKGFWKQNSPPSKGILTSFIHEAGKLWHTGWRPPCGHCGHCGLFEDVFIFFMFWF